MLKTDALGQASLVRNCGATQGPHCVTGGPSTPPRGARRRGHRKVTGQSKDQQRTLNIQQWNAEGVYQKKVALSERLQTEKIDIACIQETHLSENRRFTVRGYQTYRMDRENRSKGGILILVHNSIPAQDFQIDTGNEAEINGLKVNTHNKGRGVHCAADDDCEYVTGE